MSRGIGLMPCPSAILFVIGVMLGTSSVWSAERYVDASAPRADDRGEGTSSSPYRSLSYAMTRLMPGDTLRIAAGTYRDALIFPKRAWSTDHPTTIVGDGDVNIIGTDVVNGWQQLRPGVFVKSGWLQEPQQVMIDGVALRQIGGSIFKGYPGSASHELAGLHRSQGGIWPSRAEGNRESMPLQSFYYDGSRQELLIRIGATSVAENSVEVASRPYLVRGQDLAGITIRHIRFRYSNTTTSSRQGAITVFGAGNTLDDLKVEDMDGVGIELTGDANAVTRCLITRSGYLGIKARGRRVLIVNNEVSFNNTRRFNKWWEAGGMKFVGDGGLQESRVAKNRVHHNYGDGIWFDWGNDSNRVQENTVAYNEGFGIQYEASSRALVLDNQVFANGQRGIYLPHSSGSLIAHNLVAANGLDGVVIIDEHREDPRKILNLRPRDNLVVANVVAWNKGSAVVLPEAEDGNQSNFNVFITAKDSPTFSKGWPRTGFGRMDFAKWRETQRQDRESLVGNLAISDRIVQAMQANSLIVDWAPLDAVRTMLVVPAAMLNERVHMSHVISEVPGLR